MLKRASFTSLFTSMKVTIESIENRLFLRWVCPVKNKRVCVGASVEDSSTGRAHTQTIKCQIENDFKYGYYDPTLLKYKPRTIGKNPTEITTVELFDLFTQHKQKHGRKLSQQSIDTRYKYLGRMLEKHLNIQAANVDKRRVDAFCSICEDTLKPDTAKQRIWLLESAWDWGKDKYQLPKENPWAGIAEQFQSVPVQPCAAFSKEEVQQIIQGFKDSRYYSHYANYVVFRFGVGTRTAEASRLKWKHISQDYRSVWIESTKTKKARTVVMPASIATMLKARKEKINPKSDDELVFTTPTGLAMNDRDFNRRAWKTVLAQKGIPYRKPYTTRKTAISHALVNGANYIEVAAAAGHNPQTMHKYYAESIQKGSVFLDFD